MWGIHESRARSRATSVECALRILNMTQHEAFDEEVAAQLRLLFKGLLFSVVSTLFSQEGGNTSINKRHRCRENKVQSLVMARATNVSSVLRASIRVPRFNTLPPGPVVYGVVVITLHWPRSRIFERFSRQPLPRECSKNLIVVVIFFGIRAVFVGGCRFGIRC